MYYETVHAEGTTEEKLQVPLVTEVPFQNTLLRTDTDLKTGTNFESSGQALQNKAEMVIVLTSNLREKKM